MWNFGDNEFPYPSFLKVPFVFVPKGSPLPLDWMALHPGFVTISATFVPRAQPGPRPGPEPKAVSAPPDAGAPEPVSPPNPRVDLRRILPSPPMEGDPHLAGPFPGRLLTVVPPPGPRQPADQLPDIAAFAAFQAKQRHGTDLALRMMQAKGHASVVGRAMNHLDAHKGDVGAALAAAKAKVSAGHLRTTEFGDVEPSLYLLTPEGLSAAARAGMKHLDAHNGDVKAALAAARAAGAAGGHLDG